MSELKLDQGCKLDFYQGKEDLMNFRLRIKPDDGIYRNGVFVFNFKVPASYPHDAPKVLCETTVFHPNIDMEGHVCLNILREDWKPVRCPHTYTYTARGLRQAWG
jgi:ubiquitin-conjugating enzyme E2 M